MRVGVFGAGAIGAFVGVRLSSAGVPVVLVGRQSLADAAPLRAIGVDGSLASHGHDLRVVTDANDAGDVDLWLVTVKSRDTAAAGRALAPLVDERTTVVSLQNGLNNAARLRDTVGRNVVAGMVSYNVVRDGSEFRQATKGPLSFGTDGWKRDHFARFEAALTRAGDRVKATPRIGDVQAGKLLLNLNNGVCAVTGVTISESLRSPVLRRCFGALIREGLAVMRAAGLRPANVVGIPPGVIARLIALPNFVVLRVAKSLVAIDPRAKSSTLQDLEAGKPTEIDELSGEIVRLADIAGVQAPANRVITTAVHELEGKELPLPFWSPQRLWAEIDR